LALVIDVSGSLSSTDLANEKAAAKALIAQMGSSDLVAVYQFHTDVRLVQDFTTNKTALNAAVDSVSGGGSTALYKAIQTASQALGSRTGRKAIVLMTDGEDTVGGTTLDQAIAAAKQAGVPVFPVGFGSVDQAVLTRIANETGGFFTNSATSANLQQILNSIGQVISSQYEISYTATSVSVDATVEITVSYSGFTAVTTRVVNRCTSGGGTSCTFMVQPQSQDVPASGFTGQILVFTQPGCAWTASANVSWITILGGTGNGNGAVSYRVDANPGGPRSAILTIGNRTVPINQAGGSSCTYAITPSSNVMTATGGSSSVRLTTATGCAWTASSNAGWMTLTTASSGTGSASIGYKVDINTSSNSRSGTLTVAGLTFTLTQSGGASATGPNISQGGIVNAASNRGGTIARGSFFTIYGSRLGPAAYQQARDYPIPDTMGGVVVNVARGSYNRRAFLHFVSDPQINAILPSDVPLGDVQLTVTYNGVVSAAATVTVVDTFFGIFSTAGGSGPGIIQNYNSATDAPLNMPSFPGKPRQIGIIWGTGLGPISTPDNQPPAGGDLPVFVEINVGGKVANRLYSGRAPNFAAVDNIYFPTPSTA
jgi:uncharacterized protein (TIGR03437 family)